MAIDNLGGVYQKYYRYQEAKELHAKAYKRLEKALGPLHEAIMAVKENVAMTNLAVGGDYLVPTRKSVVVFHREKLGKEHGWTF